MINSTVAALPVRQAMADLGRTLVSEHVVSALAGYEYFVSPEWADGAIDEVAAALGRLSEAGIHTVVETGSIGCGRSVEVLSAAAKRTGISVIIATGLALPSGASAAFRSLDAVGLADVFVREIADGIPHAGTRAGAITFGVDERGDDFDETVMLAAAFAHAETGLPVVAAGGSAAIARWQVEALMARGVDPERIVSADLDRPTTSWQDFDAIANTGVQLGITRAGYDDLPAEARAAMIGYAVRRYGADRVCLSVGVPAVDLGPTASRGRPEPRAGVGGLLALFAMLPAAGVRDDDLEAMLVKAPRLLFDG